MSKPSLMYCGSCSYFLFEADGYGICNITNSERRCSDTCRKYAENPMITSETGSKSKINQKTS